ncbi:DNA repair protein endonuclease SAE2/CtIP C-terminus-domain-containing protein [Crassisporium funariophilum]|nr:DNA repair protein endonuclease SAE2/CtIP C-terminus-domain-containing protein [Crassisporium funariophilum]
MSAEAAVSSSSTTRDGDRLLTEKHQKELDALERKLQRIKYNSEETAKELFDSVNRGRRLAQVLGFNDVYDAQVTIDSADYDITFRECYDRLQTSDAQLTVEKQEVEILKLKLRKLQEQNDQLQARLERQAVEKSVKSTEAGLREELKQLRAQYDALKDVKERAAERYKADFKKWREFNKWLFAEEDEQLEHRNESGITREEKKKRDIASILRRKQKMVEIGPDLARFEGGYEGFGDSTTPRAPPPLGGTDMEDDKENDGTPLPPQKKHRVSTTPNTGYLTSHSAMKDDRHRRATTVTPTPARNSLLKTVTNIAAPSSSPTVFLDPALVTKTAQPSSSRVPLAFKPIPNTIQIKEEPSSTPSPLNCPKQSLPLQRSVFGKSQMCGSSDTEDDSQAVYLQATDGLSGKNRMFKVPAPPPPTNPLKASPNLHKDDNRPSSETEDDSQVPVSGKATHPSMPFRLPFAPASSTVETRTKTTLSLAQPMQMSGPSLDSDREYDRPLKVRRLSGDDFGAPVASSSRLQQRFVPRASWPEASRQSSNLRLGDISSTNSSKGKHRAEGMQSEVMTPVMTRTSGQKRIEDYSVFKGRGRYGQAAVDGNQPGDLSINAQYVINPAQNGGLDYQYDQVVRNRDERRKLDAGDCECCREYYEGIGPLPTRLQQPLWRSPPSTPAKPCPRHHHQENESRRGLEPHSRNVNDPRQPDSGQSSSRRQSDIDSHKKAISRHRHAWARPKTPPGYWNIGFPSTQEAGDINEKAKQMHKRKKDQVDKEAGSETGRYHRR